MKRILAALGVSGLALLGATAPAAANDNAKSDHKITICHATGSATNPYVPVTIDVHALNAHKDHQHSEDIIPGNHGKVLPGGRNLDKMAIWNAGCKVPDGPGNGHGNNDHKITICHATGSASNPYRVITIDVHAVKAHSGHQHGEDIIPGGQNWDAKGQATHKNGCVPTKAVPPVKPPVNPPANPPVVPPAVTPETPGENPRGAVVPRPAGAGAVVGNNPGLNVQTAAAASEGVIAPWAASLVVMLLAGAGVAARKVVPASGVSRVSKD